MEYRRAVAAAPAPASAALLEDLQVHVLGHVLGLAARGCACTVRDRHDGEERANAALGVLGVLGLLAVALW